MTRYGPPPPKARPYPYALEVLESQANKTLINEYTDDVKLWLAHLESILAPNPAMIDLQPEVQWYMRPYLLDFLIELHQLFRLQPATLFLAINIIDRYCAKRIVFKRHYQLVGCTALWIAGKYEDKKSRVPTLRELAIMCRQAYDDEMFVQMEMHILATLDWSISHPSLEECLQMAISESGVLLHHTPCKYNRPKDLPASISSAASRASAVAAVARFFCELSLYDRFFLTVPTSLVATAANLLACSMLSLPHAGSHLASLMSAIPDLGSQLVSSREKENEPPRVVSSFLSGFDASTVDSLRKIVLVLFLQTTSLSEVLQRKYDALGVIPVLQNFNNRHPQAVKMVIESSPSILADDPQCLANLPVCHVADLLLSLPTDDLKLPNASSNLIALPLTPPSASHLSVFSSQNNSSSAYNTPVMHGDPHFYSPVPDHDAWSSPLPAEKLKYSVH